MQKSSVPEIETPSWTVKVNDVGGNRELKVSVKLSELELW